MKIRFFSVLFLITIIITVFTGCNQFNEVKHPGSTVIPEDEAISIALEHAGFSPERITGLHASYEVDDGIPQYEVDFHQDRWDYDYIIDAQTGDIISYDKDA